MAKQRILTGDRPTGKLHLGHLVGSLQNRVKLQSEYDTFIMVADVQALTDNFDNPQKVRDNVRQVVLGNLAAGLEPDQVTIFIQSQIPQIAELTVFFMNLVTLARVQRNPTVKTEMQQKGFSSEVPLGFVAYPVSQAADILFLKSNLVPVGEDQLPMIEQTREIARRFNSLYGPVFPEPEALIGSTARLVGTDGNAKMSKSLNNTIYLSDSAEQVSAKVMSMYTDPNRLKATDPGRVEGNPLFIYLDTFGAVADQGQINDYKQRYAEGKVGDVEVKKYLADLLNRTLDPIRQRYAHFDSQPQLIEEILRRGYKQALQQAEQTMSDVRRAMKIDY